MNSLSDLAIEKEPLLQRYFGETVLFKWRIMVKRGIDMTLGVFFLLMGLPLFILIALLIKTTSRGSVFFRQDRVGDHGQIFRILKMGRPQSGHRFTRHIQ